MKTFARSILFTSALAMGANGLMATSSSNGWIDQWYRAKFGRSSPQEEARQKAERENEAFREESTSEVAKPANTWFDQWYRAKYGRSSPQEEARQKAERANIAFREEPTPAARPANDWLEQWYKAKYGRSSPMAEARQKSNVK
jgi:hypothetical protein